MTEPSPGEPSGVARERLASVPVATGTGHRLPPDCWRTIGVAGDRSCPELEAYIHCRNCPVLADAARTFFDRPAPEGYLESWSRILEVPEKPADTSATSVLVFRLGREWFALPSTTLVEVTPQRPLHRVPHRGAAVLEGLVNIRGQLQLCVSLHRLFGLPAAPVTPSPPPGDADPGTPSRLLVVEPPVAACDRWVFPVDQVAGVHQVRQATLRPVPSTVSQSASRYSQTLFEWQTMVVALLDEQRLFADLRHMVAD